MPKLVWTEDRLAEASAMWKGGTLTADMAEHFGTTEDSISNLAGSRRDLFPHRKNYFRRAAAPVRSEKPRTEVLPSYPDRVMRRTAAGALVTLPRVVFIDGPYTGAAE
ncbi:GcrA cell cycle regulator [Neorhizobium sp. S3-V5DH]|uniref:GcrA cell cycle regulator n=1 Tax=Neorhizobium sp. S3-V5DH TaxID=2485166 RepID=UPI0010466964|nr:GcrA cell cycle regulator [Neorhizobium sp. S3-V5DH]TCV66299.1 hypothetical protein EDE09_11650 [Neorhizobium sp. S3-V5DH]